MEKGSRREGKKQHRQAKVVLNGGQKAIRDAVTWRYNWIQAYKKDCYLFAQYKAEELMVGQQAKQQTDQQTDQHADQQAKQPSEKQEFCEKFIQMAAGLPEPNRRLLDRMYETAWRLYFRFCLGVEPEYIPDPWYDTPEEETAAEQETTAEPKSVEESQSVVEPQTAAESESTEDDKEYWG